MRERKPWIQREILLPALAATAAFWLLTCWTGYPYLVDDHVFAWKAKLPGYRLWDYGFYLIQRPIQSLLGFLSFKWGLFEKTKILFPAYYFLHSVGLLLIFRYLLAQIWPEHGRARWGRWEFLVIPVLISLYPGWYEATLMAVNLPYQLGVLFLGLALFVPGIATRTLFCFLSYCALETYVLPAFALGALAFAGDPAINRKWRLKTVLAAAQAPLLPPLLAALSYLAFQLLLSRWLGLQTRRGMVFDLGNAWFNGWAYWRMLWYQTFYKVNWVSTALELGTLVVTALILVRRDFPWLKRVLVLIGISAFGAAHALVMPAYSAPRAIHGAMVLKTAGVGVLLIGWYRTLPAKRLLVRTLPAALVALAYLCHHGLIVHNRAHNHSVMSAKESEIEGILRTCQEPCRVKMSGIEGQLYWDWYMQPTYHGVFVALIQERMGNTKKVLIE